MALNPHGDINIIQHQRQYTNYGPNALWHMYSYYKLKQFGICTNGCIDDYSRYVLWMEADTSKQ